jgi:DNA-binding NtrC family response regulator
MGNAGILFVDDDRAILELVREYLAEVGYRVEVVDNGVKALEMIKDTPFEIVFTDIKMPDIDGLELLSAIKEYRPETEVIIVTGHGSMESAIKAMKFGSYDYLQKPFKLNVLKIIIDRIVEEKTSSRKRSF